MFVDWSKSLLRGIQHCAGRVVHRTEKHAGKGQGDVMLWLGFGAPFAPFHASTPFAADHVGPGPGHGYLALPSMKINQHLPLGGLAASLVVEIDQLLIVALHEINFDALDP